MMMQTFDFSRLVSYVQGFRLEESCFCCSHAGGVCGVESLFRLRVVDVANDALFASVGSSFHFAVAGDLPYCIRFTPEVFVMGFWLDAADGMVDRSCWLYGRFRLAADGSVGCSLYDEVSVSPSSDALIRLCRVAEIMCVADGDLPYFLASFQDSRITLPNNPFSELGGLLSSALLDAMFCLCGRGHLPVANTISTVGAAWEYYFLRGLFAAGDFAQVRSLDESDLSVEVLSRVPLYLAFRSILESVDSFVDGWLFHLGRYLELRGATSGYGVKECSFVYGRVLDFCLFSVLDALCSRAGTSGAVRSLVSGLLERAGLSSCLELSGRFAFLVAHPQDFKSELTLGALGFGRLDDLVWSSLFYNLLSQLGYDFERFSPRFS